MKFKKCTDMNQSKYTKKVVNQLAKWWGGPLETHFTEPSKRETLVIQTYCWDDYTLLLMK